MKMLKLWKVLLFLVVICDLFICSKCILSVAFECGKPSLYLNGDVWIKDPSQNCINNYSLILNYCRMVYRKKTITSVVSVPSINVNILNWCPLRSTNCSSLVTGNYMIKPYVCLEGMGSVTPFVPGGCQFSKIGDKNNICESFKYWESFSSEFCKSKSKMLHSLVPSSPCIKEGQYDSLFFIGANVVCCTQYDIKRSGVLIDVGAIGESDAQNEINNATNFNEKINKLITNDLSSKITNDDKVLSDYFSSTNQKSLSGISIPEHERYNRGRQALNDGLKKREEILKQELVDAESSISTNDWQMNPIQSQIAENNLLKEFRQKFNELENEFEHKHKSLELIHHERVETKRLERRTEILNAWDKAVNLQYPNNFTLFETLKRLVKVIQHDKHQLIKRYENLLVNNPREAVSQLLVMKKQIIALDALLNVSLNKLDLLPKYKPDLLNYFHHLQQTQYAQINAATKSFLVTIDSPNQIKLLPSPQEQSSLKAEHIITKYRHHLDYPISSSASSPSLSPASVLSSTLDKIIPIRINGQSNGLSESNSPKQQKFSLNSEKNHSIMSDMNMNFNDELPEEITKFTTTTIPTSPTTFTTNTNDNSFETTTTSINILKSFITYTSLYHNLHTIKYTQTSTTPNTNEHLNQSVVNRMRNMNDVKLATLMEIKTIQNVSQLNNSSVLSLKSTNQVTIISVTCISIISIIIFLILILFIIRWWYMTHLCHRRKGYTLSVVEVDEVISSKYNPIDTSSISISPSFYPMRNERIKLVNEDSILNWQMNGYENPAYKFINPNTTIINNNDNADHNLETNYNHQTPNKIHLNSNHMNI